ncbi:type IV secretory system conjugative DNA transfer family protein [Streptomyces sp. SP2-10]|uniref:type IV secretory system conjugative DNA transfer family protein n=1 Tax=Streptomyces sp. SP2-10 TaxID=2873385 RepID=UPI001CA6B2D0|nr:type IV secretory system conjugative DNA transfer family protein [Streptomyces sp. SP2-10]MBY8843445.1 type IV secretory system conjugative DNA transfer family protein [Streptomyces sp. SP2-10]
MRPDDRRDSSRQGQGGIPDGLLIGLLAFLLGMTVLVWTATGLAAWFARGAWPGGVTFTRTPLAMRHLIGRPHDIAGAWPDSPPAGLSGWGLFWGLFIGQLMVLFVLTMFVMGTVARWRSGRARRPSGDTAKRHDDTSERHGATAERHTPPEPRHDAPAAPYGAPTHRRDQATPAPRHAVPEPRHETPEPTSPPPSYDVPAPRTDVPLPRTEPEPLSPRPVRATVAHEPAVGLPADGGRAGGWETGRGDGPVLYAPPAARRTTAVQAIRDASGPALVVTSNPDLWAETKDAKTKLGPTLLYDPAHLCDTPARLHWSPTAGCADRQTALHRATALITPVRPTAKIDQAVADTAITLLRSYLHAAALENRTIRHVHRWAQGTQVQDAVRTLRTHTKAAPGAAGELEAALTGHPERRDIAQELTSRALSALFTVNIRESCTPNRTDALALDSFVHEGGTLYVVGESIEDPRSNPGAMPLLTALVSSVVERGRRMAERSSSGRLDPPLTLVLDDIAAVAPFPELPDLLATGADQGLPTLALLRSREQARSRWPHQELPV